MEIPIKLSLIFVVSMTLVLVVLWSDSAWASSDTAESAHVDPLDRYSDLDSQTSHQHFDQDSHLKFREKDARGSRVKRGTSNSKNTKPSNCTADQFQCQNGDCIVASYTCDGDVDCTDLSDEVKCSPCHHSWVQCPVSKRCARNIYGCPDLAKTTRSTTTRPRRCQEDDFRCANGQCILAAYQCDGDIDCRDKSDEADSLCNSNSFTPSTITPTKSNERSRNKQVERSTTPMTVKTTRRIITTTPVTTTTTTTTTPTTTTKVTIKKWPLRSTSVPFVAPTTSPVTDHNFEFGGSLKNPKKISGIELDHVTTLINSQSFVNGFLASMLASKIPRTEWKILELFQIGMTSKANECRWTTEDFQIWEMKLREIKVRFGNLSHDPGFEILNSHSRNERQLTDIANWTLTIIKSMGNVAKFGRIEAESNYVILKFSGYLREKILWRRQRFPDCKWNQADRQRADEKIKSIFDQVVDDGFMGLSQFLQSIGSNLDKFYSEKMRREFKLSLSHNRRIYGTLFEALEDGE